jgi:hypothetical protein
MDVGRGQSAEVLWGGGIQGRGTGVRVQGAA